MQLLSIRAAATYATRSNELIHSDKQREQSQTLSLCD
jgi:hypothetical protein